MSSEYEYVQRLVRLKRYEQPDERYYEEFVDEFRRRRIAEESGQRLGPSIGERLGEWFEGLGSKRWLYGGGLAYAAIMIGVFFNASVNSSPVGGDIAELDKPSATVIPVVNLSDDAAANSVLDSSKDEPAKKPSSAATE